MEKPSSPEESQIEQTPSGKSNKFSRIRKIIGTGIVAGAAAVGGAMYEKSSVESAQKAKVENTVVGKIGGEKEAVKFTAEKVVKFMKDHYYAELVEKDIVFGDLDGDGEDDAAFLFDSGDIGRGGTEESVCKLGVVLNNKGGIGHVFKEDCPSEKDLYNEGDTLEVKIESGNIVLNIRRPPGGRIVSTSKFKVVPGSNTLGGVPENENDP